MILWSIVGSLSRVSRCVHCVSPAKVLSHNKNLFGVVPCLQACLLIKRCKAGNYSLYCDAAQSLCPYVLWKVVSKLSCFGLGFSGWTPVTGVNRKTVENLLFQGLCRNFAGDINTLKNGLRDLSDFEAFCLHNTNSLPVMSSDWFTLLSFNHSRDSLIFSLISYKLTPYELRMGSQERYWSVW